MFRGLSPDSSFLCIHCAGDHRKCSRPASTTPSPANSKRPMHFDSRRGHRGESCSNGGVHPSGGLISRLTPSWGIWSSDFTPIRTTYTPRPTHVSTHRSTRRRHRPSASGIGGRAESSAFTGQYIGRGRCGVCTLVLIWSPQPSCFSPSPPPLLERRA